MRAPGGERNSKRYRFRLWTEVGPPRDLRDAPAERRTGKRGRLNLRGKDVPISAHLEPHGNFGVARNVTRMLGKTAGNLRLLSRKSATECVRS